jgi:hypothetical protein
MEISIHITHTPEPRKFGQQLMSHTR